MAIEQPARLLAHEHAPNALRVYSSKWLLDLYDAVLTRNLTNTPRWNVGRTRYGRSASAFSCNPHMSGRRCRPLQRRIIEPIGLGQHDGRSRSCPRRPFEQSAGGAVAGLLLETPRTSGDAVNTREVFVCGAVNRPFCAGERDQDELGGHPTRVDWGARFQTLVDLVSFTREWRVFLSVAGHRVS